MSIFENLFGKKDEGSHSEHRDACAENGCSCGGACGEKGNGRGEARTSTPSSGDEAAMRLTVMGTGCKKCHQLHENALEAAGRFEVPIRVEYVTDIAEIAAAGVMSTPALLVDDKLVSSGKLLSADEIERLVGQKESE